MSDSVHLCSLRFFQGVGVCVKHGNRVLVFIVLQTCTLTVIMIHVYPPKGTAKAVPERVHLTSLSILYVIEEPKLGLQK